MLLLSTDALREDIAQFSQDEHLLGVSTDRYAFGAAGLGDDMTHSMAERYESETPQHLVDDFVTRKVGLCARYGVVDDIDWCVLLRQFLKGIWERSRSVGYYTPLRQHFIDLLKIDVQDRNLLEPEAYEYHLASDYPFRDRIIYFRAVYKVGKTLLEQGVIEGGPLAERIAFGLQSNPRTLPLVRSAGSLVQCQALVFEIWEAIANLYDVGRLVKGPRRDLLLATWSKSIPPFQGARPPGQESSALWRKVALAGYSQWPDTLRSQDLVRLADATWDDADTWLKNETPGAVEDLWATNPLAVLLVASLYLTELPARLCWKFLGGHSELKLEHLEPALPFESITLDPTSGSSSLEFKNGRGIDTSGRMPQHWPVDDRRFRFARVCLGPTVFALMGPDAADDFVTCWVDQHGTRISSGVTRREPAAGERLVHGCMRIQAHKRDFEEISVRFAQYHRPPTALEVEAFVSQFPPWLVDGVIRMLHKTRIITQAEFEAAFDSFHKANTALFTNGTILAPLDSKGGSAQIMSYIGSHVPTNCGNSGLRDALEDLKKGHANRIVILEDCLFSGYQSSQILLEYINARKGHRKHVEALPIDLQEALRGGDVILAPLFAREQGVVNTKKALCEQFPRMSVVQMATLEAEALFSEKMDMFDVKVRSHGENFFGDVGYEILKDRALKRWEADKCEMLRRKNAIGFGNDQLLVAFFYNVPKSTVTLLWEKGKYKGEVWIPLLPIRDN